MHKHVQVCVHPYMYFNIKASMFTLSHTYKSYTVYTTWEQAYMWECVYTQVCICAHRETHMCIPCTLVDTYQGFTDA